MSCLISKFRGSKKRVKQFGNIVLIIVPFCYAILKSIPFSIKEVLGYGFLGAIFALVLGWIFAIFMMKTGVTWKRKKNFIIGSKDLLPLCFSCFLTD
jgi:hypothetical protein